MFLVRHILVEIVKKKNFLKWVLVGWSLSNRKIPVNNCHIQTKNVPCIRMTETKSDACVYSVYIHEVSKNQAKEPLIICKVPCDRLATSNRLCIRRLQMIDYERFNPVADIRTGCNKDRFFFLSPLPNSQWDVVAGVVVVLVLATDGSFWLQWYPKNCQSKYPMSPRAVVMIRTQIVFRSKIPRRLCSIRRALT